MKRIKKEKRKELLSRLERFVADEVAKEEANYTQWYRESKWYKPAAMEDAFSEDMVRDILDLKDAVNKGEDLTARKSRYEYCAREYGRSWWDEDLQCYRSGYEWETNVYVFLHNIVAEAAGGKQLHLDECYEGYGDC